MSKIIVLKLRYGLLLHTAGSSVTNYTWRTILNYTNLGNNFQESLRHKMTTIDNNKKTKKFQCRKILQEVHTWTANIPLNVIREYPDNCRWSDLLYR